MRKLAACLCLVCTVLFLGSCGKDGIIPAGGSASKTQIDTQLIPGTYTSTLVEGSNDGIHWANLTLAGTREVITLSPQHTYTAGTLVNATGLIADSKTGTWSLSTDGNSFTCYMLVTLKTDFTILSLTPTAIVVSFNGSNVNTLEKNSIYTYNRITYTRS